MRKLSNSRMFLRRYCNLIFTSIALISSARALHARAQSSYRIAARVGEEIITQFELESRMSQVPFTQQNQKSIRQKCLNELIDEALLIQEFNARKGNILKYYLDNQTDAFIQSNFQGNRTAFMHYLESRHQSFLDFQNEIKRSIIINVMRQQSLKNALNTSPKAIENYYQAHLADFTEAPSIFLEQKCFKEESIEENTNISKINYYDQKIKEGISPNALAAELDELKLPNAWYNINELNQTLAQHASQLALNTFSKPILVNHVYIMLRVLDRKPAKVQALSSVQSTIEERIIEEKNEQAYQTLIRELKEKTFIETY